MIMDKSQKMEKIEEEIYAYTDFRYDLNTRKWYVILDGSFVEEDLIKILDALPIDDEYETTSPST